jgi:hypothetical protein
VLQHGRKDLHSLRASVVNIRFDYLIVYSFALNRLPNAGEGALSRVVCLEDLTFYRSDIVIRHLIDRVVGQMHVLVFEVRSGWSFIFRLK